MRQSRRHWGEDEENILKPFLFRSSIILAVLYLAASSTRKKIVLELFLLEFWSFWYVAAYLYRFSIMREWFRSMIIWTVDLASFRAL